MRERTIKYALDKISGEILDADKIFKHKPEGFEVRKDNALDLYELTCLECKQELTVSSSKYDRLHFKHLPNHDYCCLSDLDLTPDDIDKFNKALIAKESDRHIELKNKIAKRLSLVEGVDISSITIDNKFIIKGTERRRPDVYCRYYDKEIVFEIQLSELSLRYILSRAEFYKKHGIYLIWILDNFDNTKHPFKRDIKYLTEYENFFKLDEAIDEFGLLCSYKKVFLTKNNDLHCKWMSKTLALKDVTFDCENFQIYHYNYSEEWDSLEIKQKKINEELKEEKRKELEKRRFENANQLAKQIINDINSLKNREISFVSVEKKVAELDEYDFSILNKKLDLKNRIRDGKPILNYWVYTGSEYIFLRFILGCTHIELDVNQKDPEGFNIFPRLLENYKTLMVELFKRGYQLTPDDRNAIIIAYPENYQRELSIYELANSMDNREYVDSVFYHPNVFLTIQSAKLNRVTGFKYASNAWIAFANNAAEHYKEHWEYIELAFKYYGIWDNLIRSDKKGTFQNKLQKLYDENPIQSYGCEEAIRDLFPEMFY